MNGMVSQSMREKGVDYKLNFGIEYPRIREIAAAYPPNHELAQALWKENIRECKIIAGILQPAETFYREIADIWIEDMRFPELAEYTVMNLFQRLPYASDAVFAWIADDREYFQLCGYLLMSRILMKGMVLNDRAAAEYLDHVQAAMESDCLMTSRAAGTSLCKYANQSREQRKAACKLLDQLLRSDHERVRLLAEETKASLNY